MSDRPENDKTRPGSGRKILTLAVVLMLIIAAAFLMVNPVFESPYISNKISVLMSERLRQKSVVGGIRLSAGSIMVNGIAIANPPGFPAGNLIKVGYLEIYPDWRSILMGKRRIRSIRIHGLHAELLRDASGAWNFSPIISLLKGKKGGAEMRLAELRLDGGSISVDGRGISDITLGVRDISTRGSTTARIELAFIDEYGSHYRIKGNGRLGDSPSFDMNLAAPEISLKHLKGFRIPIDTEKGKGGLDLSLAFGNDELKVSGEARVDPLIVLTGDESGAHRVGLSFAGRYLLKRDQAALDGAELRLDDGPLRLRAKGFMEGLRKERDFSLEISHQGIRLADVLRLLPSKINGGLLISGEILPTTVRVRGRVREGITSASGDLALRGLTVSRNGRLMAENIAANANVAAQVDGWRLNGRVSQGERRGTPLILLRDIPFNIVMDRRFRSAKGEIPSFSAELAGVPVRGRVLFREAGSEPISATIDIGRGTLAGVTRRFPIKGLELSKGTVYGLARAYGDLTGKFRGDASLTLSGIQGRYAGREIGVSRLWADGTVRRSGGNLSASARIGARDGVLDGRNFSFSIPCAIRGRVLAVEGGEGRFEKAVLRIGKMNISLPGEISPVSGKVMKVGLNFNGIDISRGEIGVEGLSGMISADLTRVDGKIGIQGNGLLEAPFVSYRGTKTGSLSARFGAKGGRVTMEAKGGILGGKVAARAEGELSDIRSGTDFSLDIKGISGERLTESAGGNYPVKLSEGSFDLSAKGKLEGDNGPMARFSITGRDISISGKNRRTIFSGGMLDLSADLAKGDLLIRDAVARVGDRLRVGLKGTLKNAAASEREGNFLLEIPRVEITSILDAFANALPPPLQEAGAAGNLWITSRITTRGMKGGIKGELDLAEGRIDIPSQKLTVTGVNGKVPFDMELDGYTTRQRDNGGVKRENYRGTLSRLQAAAGGGHNLVIEKVRFGAAEFDGTRLSIEAGNGVTEVTSLASSLFRGEILGRGSFTLAGGGRFWGDLLVHDLSLRELCDSYPAIKGYMSGRVDGFASLFAEGRNISDIKGLMEFWSRSADDEKMLISKEFLQKLSGKKLKGLFFKKDRPYDRGEIVAYLEEGFMSFRTLNISHTNMLGIRDLSVTVSPLQNKISLEHLLAAIREAASRGKAATGGGGAEKPPPATEFKWEE